MDWFPVSLELLGSLEFERLPLELLGVWVRLCVVAARRESGGRIPGVTKWTRDEFPRLVGTGVTRGLIGKLEAAGLVRWDGEDLVVLHYPIEAENRLRRQREAGAIRTQSGPNPDEIQTPSDRETDRPDGVGSPRSLGLGARVAPPLGGGSKSKSKSKRGREISSGISLRELPDPPGQEAPDERQASLFPEAAPPRTAKPPRWRNMLDAFARGAGQRWTEGPVIDRGLAIRLGQIAADLKAAGVTGADIVQAGAYAARGRREQLTPSWVATTGRLAEAIARARHAEESPIAEEAGWVVIRGGKKVSPPMPEPTSSPESDDRHPAAADLPPPA